MITVASLSTLQDLRVYVLKTLCKHDNLDPAVTPLHQGMMTRAGLPSHGGGGMTAGERADDRGGAGAFAPARDPGRPVTAR